MYGKPKKTVKSVLAVQMVLVTIVKSKIMEVAMVAMSIATVKNKRIYGIQDILVSLL